MLKNIFLILAVLLTVCCQAFGQDSSETARAKLDRAVELIEQGVYDKALALLDEAEALAPGSYAYTYEKGRAYYMQNDFSTALDLFRKSLRYKDATDLPYKMIGNIYDITGHPQRALSTYESGLEKFPGSGLLHFESGLVYMHQEKPEEALKWYEWGMEADPYYPSNYYHAAMLRLSSEDRAYGMMQGETFINLEPDTRRTSAMSKRLYEAYRENITIANDSLISVSFSTIPFYNFLNKDFRITLSFPAAYELALAMSINSTVVDLSSLNDLRSRFVDIWYEKEGVLASGFYSPLFDFQRRIMEAGHLEAYNYWVLADGDPTAFDEWLAGNKDKYEAFLEWHKGNPIILH